MTTLHASELPTNADFLRWAGWMGIEADGFSAKAEQPELGVEIVVIKERGYISCDGGESWVVIGDEGAIIPTPTEAKAIWDSEMAA